MVNFGNMFRNREKWGGKKELPPEEKAPHIKEWTGKDAPLKLDEGSEIAAEDLTVEQFKSVIAAAYEVLGVHLSPGRFNYEAILQLPEFAVHPINLRKNFIDNANEIIKQKKIEDAAIKETGSKIPYSTVLTTNANKIFEGMRKLHDIAYDRQQKSTKS